MKITLKYLIKNFTPTAVNCHTRNQVTIFKRKHAYQADAFLRCY